MPNMLKHMSVIYTLEVFVVWYLLYVLLGCFIDILLSTLTTLVYIPGLPYLLKCLVLTAA